MSFIPFLGYATLAGGAAYTYKSGVSSTVESFFGLVSDITSDKNEVRNRQQQQQNQAPPRQVVPQPKIIITQPAARSNINTFAAPMGTVLIVAFGAYYYYSHSFSTQKVISSVEENAEQTQDLVVKSDVNNAKRFEVLDDKNEQRAQNLEAEIRSENRAGFEILSEQLYCLTQVAIQTLSAIASGPNNEENGDFCPDEKLLGYADKAQGIADTILSDDHMLQTKEHTMKEVRAEINLRYQQGNEMILNQPVQQPQPVMVKSDYTGLSNANTPGGPDDFNPNSDAQDAQEFSTSLAKKSKARAVEAGQTVYDFFLGKQFSYLQFVLFKPAKSVFEQHSDKIISGTAISVGVWLLCKSVVNYLQSKNSTQQLQLSTTLIDPSTL